MFAHIGGVPVEESLLYLAPVVALVVWMYYAGWRERRGGKAEEEQISEAPAPDEQNLRSSGAPARHD